MVLTQILVVVREFPYLTASLSLILLSGATVLLSGCRPRVALWSGIAALPGAGCAVIFVPDYWRPRLLLQSGVGIEDLLFCFAAGSLVWSIVDSEIRRDGPELAVMPRVALGRLAVVITVFLAILLPLWLAGMASMQAGIAAACAVVGCLRLLRPELRRAAARGAIGFCAGYCLWLAAVVRVLPQFGAYWTVSKLSGVYLLGFPVEEAFWALAYGASWPLIVAYLLGPTPGSGSGRPDYSSRCRSRGETAALRFKV